jgi:hypothetical protein
MPVSFKEIRDAFEFISVTAGYENRAILCRKTGKIYTHSDFPDFEEFNDELPDDVDDEEKYLDIPDRYELDLGKPLVMDFARDVLPSDFEEIRDIFRRRGAYQRFKALLTRRNALDRWYEYESRVTDEALRGWCSLNEIELTD